MNEEYKSDQLLDRGLRQKSLARLGSASHALALASEDGLGRTRGTRERGNPRKGLSDPRTSSQAYLGKHTVP